MVRMIPMIPAGIICNIFIGLLVGKIYGVVLICKFLYIVLGYVRSLTSYSCRLPLYRHCRPSLCCHRPRRCILGVRFPSSCYCCSRCRFRFCGRQYLHCQTCVASRAKLGGWSVPDHGSGKYYLIVLYPCMLTIIKLGTSFGLAITTIVFDRVRAEESSKLGIIIDSQGLNAPPGAQLKAYRAAQWTVMGFGVFGECYLLASHHILTIYPGM